MQHATFPLVSSILLLLLLPSAVVKRVEVVWLAVEAEKVEVVFVEVADDWFHRPSPAALALVLWMLWML